jgi:nicotinate phosphoribosyltransferase
MGIFHIARDNDIKKGRTTDVYFSRARDVLLKKGIKVRVVAEVTASGLPRGYGWGVLAGVEEVARLFEGYEVDVYSMPEGSIFHPWEPVLRIEGEYTVFAELETPLLGFICQSSGIATKTARLRKVAGDKVILSFGIRRMHPAISPMVDRAAYIGGADGFSGLGAEKLVGKKASGTMPHALIIAVGDQVRAWRLYDEVLKEEVPRIALVDTYCDEKTEAVMAARAVKDLYGVRLDTPRSRRGSMADIIEEVRWELDIRGYGNVKIFVSGGVDEADIPSLKAADGFGVGTSISNSPTIDFAMDIVEMQNQPVAKRGKRGGKKEVFRCSSCMRSEILYHGKSLPCPECGGEMERMLKPLVRDGRIVMKLPSAEEIRNYVLSQLRKVD